MNVGKRICETLKTIRKQIADANGIVYEPKKCNFKGECRGTCQVCEQEVKYIEKQLNAPHAGQGSNDNRRKHRYRRTVIVQSKDNT